MTVDQCQPDFKKFAAMTLGRKKHSIARECRLRHRNSPRPSTPGGGAMIDKLKKQLILNLPYTIFVYIFDKLC